MNLKSMKYLVLTLWLLALTPAELFCQNESRQFDFWIGEWKVQNRFKQDDNTWKDEGEGYLKVWPVLDGKAIMEFWDGTGRSGNIIKGFSLRYYDRSKEKWIVCLNWPQVNNGGFFFLTGNFRFNRCEIYNRRPLKNGQYALTHYVFSDITDTTYRWQGYNSLDSGKTWSSNWIMENYRISDIPQWPESSDKFHTYNDDSFSTVEESKRFHSLEGTWKGELSDSTNQGWITDPIDVTFWKVQNGISMFYELQSESGLKEIGLLTYRVDSNLWLSMRLDNKVDSEIITKYWKAGDENVLFKEYSQLFEKNTTETDKYYFDNNRFIINRSKTNDSSREIISKQTITLTRSKNNEL